MIVVVFGLLFGGFFFPMWIAGAGLPQELRAPLYLTALFLTASPPLALVWQLRLRHALHVLTSRASDEAWSTTALDATMTTVARAYLGWTIPSILFALGTYAIAGDVVTQLFGVSRGLHVGHLIGLAWVVSLGTMVGTGLWGVWATTYLTVRTLQTAAPWFPYRSGQAEGLEALSKFAFLTGLLFSTGSAFAPAWLKARDFVDGPADLLFVGGFLAFFFMGVVAFVVPTMIIHAYARRQKDVRLEQFADTLETLEAQVLGGRAAADVYERTRAVVALRQVVAAENPYPSVQVTLGRVASTVILPVLIYLATLSLEHSDLLDRITP